MQSARTERTIYLRVLAPLALAVLTLVVLSVGGFHALSGTRAYVGGESMWSKATSRTVAQLRARLNASGPVERCEPMDVWLAVPLGDREARLELDKTDPDYDVIRRGFIRGGNAPDDVDAMIHLYRNFGALPLMREPIEAWRRGDELVAQLIATGERICALAPEAVDANARMAHLASLDRLEAELYAAEARFSQSLGSASRRTGQLLGLAIVLLAIMLSGGGVWYAVRSLRAQLEQQRALEVANERWELVAEAGGIGMFVWTPADDTIALDARGRRLYELPPADGLEPLPRALLAARRHPEDPDPTGPEAQQLRYGQAMRVRYRIILGDGSSRHIEAIGKLQDAQAPDQQRMFGAMRDVTDETVATRLQLERDAAERVARARTEFLSRLSHELRTPLNAVLGLAQVLEVDTVEPLRPLQRQRVEMILQGGWQLLHLVDDVLDLTSIDAGRPLVRLEPAELRPVLRASLAQVEPLRAEFDIAIDDRWPAEPARVVADPKRLQQVFVNLLSNACKYNRRGGRVTLDYLDAGTMLCLAFEDQGRGMSAADQAELFQPFKRLGDTGDAPGTGLGLVVVKLLCEQMGGRVEVRSAPDEGARFSIWLRKA